MKIVLGGEEESEKNRVLLGPLREETRKLITLDACIALEGVRVASAYTTDLGPNELKFNESDDKRSKMNIVGGSRINLLDDDEKFTYADVQLQKPSTILCGPAEKKIINARFWIEAIGSVLQGPKKERVELAVRDEDGVKRKLVFFESLVELPLEVGDTMLCVGLMASEYGGRIMWNAYANTCMILKVGDDLESLRLHFSD